MNTIARTKARIDLVDLISSTVELHPSGHRLKGICPFHPDSVPSLTVFPDEQRFYCFGCQARGDVIDWLMMLESLDFRTALERLSGGELEIPKAPVRRNGKVHIKKPVPLQIVRYWHGRLNEYREYFRRRLFTDETIETELWGWTGQQYTIPVWDGPPGNGGRAVQVKFRRNDEVERAKLAGKGLEGEALEETLDRLPKYMALTGHGSWLYDGWKAKEAKAIFVFFGELDAALFNQDFRNLRKVAACSPTGGAASWDDSWRDTFKRAKEVIVVPDKGEEEEGFTFAARIGGHARSLPIPDSWPGKDYCDVRASMKAYQFLQTVWKEN